MTIFVDDEENSTIPSWSLLCKEISIFAWIKDTIPQFELFLPSFLTSLKNGSLIAAIVDHFTPNICENDEEETFYGPICRYSPITAYNSVFASFIDLPFFLFLDEEHVTSGTAIEHSLDSLLFVQNKLSRKERLISLYMNPDHPLVFDPNQLLLESTAIISQEAVSSHLFIATNVSTCDDEKKEFQSTRPNEPFHFAHQNDEERTENEKCESNEEQRAIPRIVQVEQRSVSSFSDSPFSERQNDKKDVALSPEQIKQTELDESNELDKIEEEEEEKEELSSEHSSMSNMLAYQSSLPLSHSSSSLFTPSAQNLTHPTSSTRQIDRFFFRISFFISFFFVVAFAVILLVFEERQGLFADDFVLKTSSSSKYSSNDISRIPQRVIPSHISSRTMKGFPPISETDDKSNYERQKNERQSQQEYIQREKFRSIAPDLAKKLPVPQRAQFQRPRITSRIVGEENYN